MTTSNSAERWPEDSEAFDEYQSGTVLVAPPARFERNPESLGCYSSVAHIYETARADERLVLTRKFARWMQLYSVRNRPHQQNTMVVARGEWLTELEQADSELE